MLTTSSAAVSISNFFPLPFLKPTDWFSDLTYSVTCRRRRSLLLAMPRPRRKSSNLGADIRGDTSAPAMSTMSIGDQGQPEMLNHKQVRTRLEIKREISYRISQLIFSWLFSGRWPTGIPGKGRETSFKTTKSQIRTQATEGACPETHMADPARTAAPLALRVRCQPDRVESPAQRHLPLLSPTAKIHWGSSDVW